MQLLRNYDLTIHKTYNFKLTILICRSNRPLERSVAEILPSPYLRLSQYYRNKYSCLQQIPKRASKNSISLRLSSFCVQNTDFQVPV